MKIDKKTTHKTTYSLFPDDMSDRDFMAGLLGVTAPLWILGLMWIGEKVFRFFY